MGRQSAGNPALASYASAEIGRNQFLNVKAALSEYVSLLGLRVEHVTSSSDSFFRELFAQFRKAHPTAGVLYAPESVALWRLERGGDAGTGLM